MSENISPSTLEVLSNSIANLQQLGGTVDDNKLRSFVGIVMHHSRIAAREEACESDKPEPLDMSNTCEQLSSVADALYGLWWSCNAKLGSLRAQMRAVSRPRGIQKLPDDVLAHIFEDFAALDAAMYGHYMSAGETLGLVCRRFHSLSLALPSLWAYLSWSEWPMPAKRAKAYLERSKAVGLTIEVGGDSVHAFPERFWTFLKLVAQHSSRWKSFKYEQLNKHSYGPEVSQTIDFLSGLDFSSLEQLDFCVYSRNDLRETDLLGRWNMPKLHHLRLACKGVLPTPESPFFSSTSIRTVDIEGKHMRLRDLGNFLVSLPNLVDLRLELYSPWEKLPLDQLIFLPNLTHLEFEFWEIKLFSDILSGLSLPQVQKLRLKFTNSEESVGSWMKAIPLDTFTTVKDLYLACTRTYSLSADQSLDLRLIFERFPVIEHLKLEVPRCWCSDIFDMKLPPLRSLALTLKPDMDVQGCVRAAERTGNIESVEVTCGDWETTMEELSRKGPLVKRTDYRGRTTQCWHRE